MDWVLASLASAILFAGVSVLDKRILTAHVTGVTGFYFLVGLLQLVMAAVAVVAVPWQGGPSGPIIAAVASGALAGGSLLALFYGLRVLDVTRAVPIFHTFPVFVAIMAVAFLDERLLAIQWVAILIVVAGAAMVAVGQPERHVANTNVLALVAVVFASLGMAASTVVTKVALADMGFWNVFALRSAFLGLVLVTPAVRPGGFGLVKEIISNRRAVVLTMITEGGLAAAAVYATLLAVSLGPVSLVATLMSTRPVFVLIISAVLSMRFLRVLDEPLTRGALAHRSVSTALVVFGVGILSLA